VRLKELGKFKNNNDLVWTQTREFPAYIKAPTPLGYRVPTFTVIGIFHIKFRDIVF
jgi:hypothetical protein